MNPVGPIYTVELFPELHSQLIQLLKGLNVDDWQTPTVCTPWSVKDVAAHLLDGYVRRLSLHRDNLPLLEPETPITSQQELIGFLDQLNADWVKAAKRISPALLIAFLDLTGPMVYKLFKGLAPDAPAFFSVGWAGDESSPNWFDIAREYTEQWMHQQHIREALGLPTLMARHQAHPVLDAFMRALPITYKSVEAADGESVAVIIEGEAGGEWTLLRQQGEWQLYWGMSSNPTTEITLNQDAAWRLFTKGISVDEAHNRVQIKGNRRFGEGILHMVSIRA